MKNSKKMIAFATIVSIALVSGSIYAQEGSGEKTVSQKTTGSVTGDGEAYSAEELAKKLGISLKELESKVRPVELSLSEATRFSGKVNNGVHTPTDRAETETMKLTSSTQGDGETYTAEELASKSGKSINDLGNQDLIVQLPLTDSAKQSGKVDNGVHTPADQAEAGLEKPSGSTQGDGESYTPEELAKKLGITIDELESQIQTFEFPLSTE
jgi:hypothetical protein